MRNAYNIAALTVIAAGLVFYYKTSAPTEIREAYLPLRELNLTVLSQTHFKLYFQDKTLSSDLKKIIIEDIELLFHDRTASSVEFVDGIVLGEIRPAKQIIWGESIRPMPSEYKKAQEAYGVDFIGWLVSIDGQESLLIPKALSDIYMLATKSQPQPSELTQLYKTVTIMNSLNSMPLETIEAIVWVHPTYSPSQSLTNVGGKKFTPTFVTEYSTCRWFAPSYLELAGGDRPRGSYPPNITRIVLLHGSCSGEMQAASLVFDGSSWRWFLGRFGT